MVIICYECSQSMGEKNGDGVTHGICKACLKNSHNEVYRMGRERDALERGKQLLERKREMVGGARGPWSKINE